MIVAVAVLMGIFVVLPQQIDTVVVAVGRTYYGMNMVFQRFTVG